MRGFVLLEVLVALAVLAVASLPVARTLAVGIERAGRASRLRAAADVARTLSSPPAAMPGAAWSRVGSTADGLPCWARAAEATAADVVWTWLEVTCRREAPGEMADDGPAGTTVRLLLSGPAEGVP